MVQVPLISCIIPTYNSERYLREALESIRGQTYQQLEIIIADDGSTDGTANVVAAYGQQIRFLRQPTAGPPATRNLGLREAQGEFVAFLDADDLWHPEKLARQMARFQARPDLDLCVSYMQNFWIPELLEEASRLKDHRRGQPMPGYYTGTLLARRTLFETVGLFNTTLWHGDATDWFLRAAEGDAVIELLPAVLTHHRIHTANLSRRMATASQDEYVRIVKASLDRRRHLEPVIPLPETQGSA